MIRYAEVTPSPGFADLVECYWNVSGLVRGRGAWNRVLPDGCMDVIVNLGDATEAESGGRNALGSYVVGMMREAIRVRHTGRADLVGIRFRPGGAVPFLGVPASELTDATAPLGAVARGASELESRLGEAGAGSGDEAALLRARGRVLEWWLAARLRRDAGDRGVLAVASALERSRGRARLSGLRVPLGISERTLERRFAALVGGSPASLRASHRVREAASRLSRDPSASLSRLALSCGYHDQAHFTREFRRLAGITPGAYARERRVGFVQSEAGDVA